MGKGDKKTKKGKITLGTFGVRRKKKASATYVAPKSKKKAPAKAAEKPEVVKKAETPKKAPAKPKAVKKKD